MVEKLPGFIMAIALSLSSVAALAADSTDATKIAGDTGCGILASLLQNPQAAVAAAGACIYGTSVANNLLGDLIDDYFEGEEQAFANKYCLTVVKSDGKRIEPTTKTNCSD